MSGLDQPHHQKARSAPSDAVDISSIVGGLCGLAARHGGEALAGANAGTAIVTSVAAAGTAIGEEGLETLLSDEAEIVAGVAKLEYGIFLNWSDAFWFWVWKG